MSLIALFMATSASAPEVGGAAGWAGRTHAVVPVGVVGVVAISRPSIVRMLFMWLSRRSLSAAPTRPLSVVMSASTASSTLLRSVLVTSTTGVVPPIGGVKSVPNRRLNTFRGLYSGGLKLSGPLWETYLRVVPSLPIVFFETPTSKDLNLVVVPITAAATWSMLVCE